MQDKYSNEIQQLMRILNQIEVLIEDNNQNIKDCLSIVRELNQAINFKKPSKLKMLFRIFKFKREPA